MKMINGHMMRRLGIMNLGYYDVCDWECEHGTGKLRGNGICRHASEDKKGRGGCPHMGNCPLSAMRKMQKVYDENDAGWRQMYEKRGELIEELRKQIPRKIVNTLVVTTTGEKIKYQDAAFSYKPGEAEYKVLNNNGSVRAVYPVDQVARMEILPSS